MSLLSFLLEDFPALFGLFLIEFLRWRKSGDSSFSLYWISSKTRLSRRIKLLVRLLPFSMCNSCELLELCLFKAYALVVFSRSC